MTGRDPSRDDRRSWVFNTAGPVKRARALLQATVSSRHEFRSTIAARPETRPLGTADIVDVGLYKIWYVLHHNRGGDDRTTNIYIRRIGSSHAAVNDMTGSTIKAGLLPVEYYEWCDDHNIPNPDETQD